MHTNPQCGKQEYPHALPSIQSEACALETKWPSATNDYFSGVRFVSFLLGDFLSSGAKGRLIYILLYIGIAPDCLFSSNNANQPFRFGPIPRNFHTVRTHGFLRNQSWRYCSPGSIPLSSIFLVAARGFVLFLQQATDVGGDGRIFGRAGDPHGDGCGPP